MWKTLPSLHKWLQRYSDIGYPWLGSDNFKNRTLSKKINAFIIFASVIELTNPKIDYIPLVNSLIKTKGDWKKKTTKFILEPFRLLFSNVRAHLYGLGYPRQPSPRGNFTERLYQNAVPVGRVKVNPALLFKTLIEQSNVQIFHLFLWVSLGHLITVCFSKLIFTSSTQISGLNPNSMWHSPCRELSQVGEPKRPPRRVCVPNVNDWLKFWKETS